MTQQQMDEKRFNKIFAFICIFGTLNLLLIAAMVFRTVPKENQQSANMALAFCMGTFTALASYLIGASPKDKRPDTVDPAPNVTVTTLKWLGKFDSDPQNPAVNDAYTNTISGKNYIWNGSAWVETTQKPS